MHTNIRTSVQSYIQLRNTTYIHTYIETYIHLGNPTQYILKITNDINTSNDEETLIAQKRRLYLANGDISANFNYVTKTTLGT